MSSPRAGHVWFDSDSTFEVVMLLRLCPEGSNTWHPRIECWEMLVTREDGSVYLDWENVDSVDEWYRIRSEHFKRIA